MLRHAYKIVQVVILAKISCTASSDTCKDKAVQILMMKYKIACVSDQRDCCVSKTTIACVSEDVLDVRAYFAIALEHTSPMM